MIEISILIACTCANGVEQGAIFVKYLNLVVIAHGHCDSIGIPIDMVGVTGCGNGTQISTINIKNLYFVVITRGGKE